jgi:hypothetical protein
MGIDSRAVRSLCIWSKASMGAAFAADWRLQHGHQVARDDLSIRSRLFAADNAPAEVLSPIRFTASMRPRLAFHDLEYAAPAFLIRNVIRDDVQMLFHLHLVVKLG